MFDSGVTVKALIDGIKAETDIAYPIPDESYVFWLSALEQLLYREVIKEQKEAEFSPDEEPIEALNKNKSGDEGAIRFEDIHAVYVKESDTQTRQLIKSTVTSGEIFPDTFYKNGNQMGLNISGEYENLRVIYFVKPKIKKALVDGYVMLPFEFLELARAKLRGEAYKIANEDDLAAKWLNEYNVLLETFRAWVEEKNAKFGM